MRPEFVYLGQCDIIDLNNIPLVTGTAYIKWRLPSSNANEHHGNTDKALIIDHRVSWNYERTLQLRLTIDRNHMLHDCEIQFDVIQEFSSGGHGEKNLLGRVKLNLSEYVDESDDDEGIVRRYLMQDSKINSTLKIGISVQQVEGDRNFTTPPLKSAMAFGGITGVVASEQAEADDMGQLPLINTQSREVADMQEMYRRTLAASWTSRADDLPADKLIEGLFSGAVGGTDLHDSSSGQPAEGYHNERSPNRGARRAEQAVSRNLLSPGYERRARSSSRHHKDNKALDFSPAIEHTEKSGSIEHQLYDNDMGKSWRNRSTEHELSEFDVRDDLRSWEIDFEKICPQPNALFPMLSRSSRHARTLLNCRLRPICRIDTICASLPPRGVHARHQNTASNSGDDAPDETKRESSNDPDLARRQPSRRITPTHRGRRDYFARKVGLSVSALGQPGEVIVLGEEKKRSRVLRQDDREKVVHGDGAHYLLQQIGETSLDNTSVAIESFAQDYKLHTNLSEADFKALREKLQSSFTYAQMREYIDAHPKPGVLQHSSHMKWNPGTSPYFELKSARGDSVTTRIADTKELRSLQSKFVLAERILRDCWQVGVVDEIGQLDLRLPSHHLSLFLGSPHFSFEDLAGMNDTSIDVVHTMGLVRVTGKQRSCENVADVLHDATNRIKYANIGIELDEERAKGIFSPKFLSWVSETYKVSFEQNSSSLPQRLFYLLENKGEAKNARRTLHLALNKARSPPVPFSTYVSAFEKADVHDVNTETTASWPDRGKSWFRWEIPSTLRKSKSSSEFLYNTSQSAISNELLDLLQRKPSASASYVSVPGVRESVTAAAGKCLFLHKPSLKEKTLSAAELGQLSFSRTFVKEVPRAGHLMRSLTPRPCEEGMRTHRIRLVPAAFHARVLPQLELEVDSPAITNDSTEDICVIRSAKAILDKTSVDYLLPEAAADIRFTRMYSLEGVQTGLRRCFKKNRNVTSAVPLPVSTMVTLPSYLSRGVDADQSSTVTAEYLYEPVNDGLGDTVAYEYEFQNQRLVFSSSEGGPFEAPMTDDLCLQMELGDNHSAASTKSLQHDFKSFYKAACALSFELNLV
ncbi:mitochondrial inner-membrane-bound regulator-domain-containing protein [Aspergillus keveii]|uniref:Mitochondrial inner-membrane-bound regulator-domain-containing protein n=1 Tax=Aspergillus keveii TaxID=714993 RepID=A0ABR4GJQ0_9EURO